MAIAQYTVKRGDSLWKICASSECGPSIAGNNIPAKINTLVSLNNIPNSNLIHPGQVLILSSSGGSSGSSAATTTPANCVTIDILNIKSDSSTGRDVYACWTWTKDKTKGYKIRWEYDKTIDGKTETQFTEDETSTPGVRHATFSVPEEVRAHNNWVQVFVTPISETYKEKDSSGNEVEKSHWTADSVGKQYHFKDNPPATPANPTCEIENTTLTMKIESIPKEKDAASIIFQVIKDNKSVIYTSPEIPVVSVTDDYGTVSHQYEVPLGSSYKVRAKAVASNGKQSGWTDFSEEKETKPSSPSITNAYRRDKYKDGDEYKCSVYLEWTAVPSAVKYKIEYTTALENFEAVDGSKTSVESDKTSATIVGIEAGKQYYFRVIAISESSGESDPSDHVVLVVGEPPEAPTTWSSVNSAFVGDDIELNWIHNSKDGSSQTSANVELSIDNADGTFTTVNILCTNTTSIEDEEPDIVDSGDYGQVISYKGNLYFKMDTTNPFLKNRKIQWRVQTAGIADPYSSLSTPRTIYVYEKPTFAMSMTKDTLGNTGMITTLESFPFYINGKVTIEQFDPNIQKPVGYHIRIAANEYYVSVDNDGTTKTINAGDSVYEKYIDTNGSLSEEISANDVDLESGIKYTLYCTVDMSTGLTLTGVYGFDVSWEEVSYDIAADISIDTNSYSAMIRPYCAMPPYSYEFDQCAYDQWSGTCVSVDSILISFDVQKFVSALGSNAQIKFSGNETKEFRLIVDDSASLVYDGATIGWGYTSDSWDAENVDNPEYLEDAWGIKLHRCSEERILTFRVTYRGFTLYSPDSMTLSVYRREYDGTYTKIASNIPNTNTSVTDPHPALDYARYRIVAKDVQTGAISFYDTPGYPVKCSSIIIQWNEEWSTFDTSDRHSVEGPPWSGSLLRLDYNVDVADSRERSVSTIEYIGREHPVSYYGTSVNESSSWTAVIPKEDKDTIYALRRLSIWTGDAYIREPSGMGYWANVKVSFNQKHKDVTIPVTLNITRVEGGI